MEKKLLDLTAPQKSIWLTEQFYSNTNINNICATVIANQLLDLNILNKAINLVVQNSDNFKIHFIEENGELKQYFENIENKNFDIIELNSKDEISTLEQTLLSRIFNINEELFEIKIFKVNNSEICGCIINIHHIIADAFSIGILCQKVMNTYNNLINNIPVEFNTNFSYENYIKSEKEYIASEKFQNDKKYWEDKFSDLPNIVSVPSISNKINVSSCTANRYSYKLNNEYTNKIQKYCKNSKISIFNLFMSILAIYLYKINNMTDFVIGTPILNRTNFNEKNTLGMFINVVPLRININPDNTISDLLSYISTDSLALLRHQKYSYQYILENIRKENPQIPNLYNIALSYQITKTTTESNINYSTRWVFNNNSANDIEIHLADFNDNGTLEIAYDYKTEKYESDEISTLNNRLLHILNQILENSNSLIKNIEIATPEEKNIILNNFNNTKKDYDKTENIISLFEKQVKLNPNKTAVVYNESQISYSELNEKANILANHLINKNIKNKIISVYLNKSTDYIISILGILKSNNIFMPISSTYPKDRIEYMIKNSESPLIISNEILINNIEPTVPYIDISNFDFSPLENYQNISIDSKSLAYIIFTSGSTGLPKGVGVSHLSVVNHVLGIQNRFENSISSSDIALSIANISFDANIQEIFIPLCFGATLHLLEDNSIYEPKFLADYIYTQKISFAFIPPTLLDILYDELCNYNEIYLDKLLVGVQSITNTTLNHYFNFNPNIKIHNGYGPTEATICCVSYMYNKKVENSNFILPIGKPMDNCEIYILDDYGNIMPPNITGELCISGDCLSNGYIKLPKKTKEKFVFLESINKLVYKTGDLAYFMKDGNIKFVGRKDNQIKLNGFRIELDEINNIIVHNTNIKSSYTLLYEDKQISSFVVKKRNSDYTIEQLKNYLKEKLPYYMMPSNIMFLKKIPSSKNGKADRSELIKILQKNKLENIEFVSAQTETEKKLENILKDILKIEKINFNNSLFELGGDSLSAIKLCSSIKQYFNIEISVKQIFEIQKLKELSEFIDNNLKNKNEIQKFLFSSTQDSYSLSSAQKRIYYTSSMSNEKTGVYNISGGLEFSDILDFQKIQNILNKIIERHEAFRTFFEINNGEIRQKILKDASINIEHTNINSKDVDKYFKKFNTEFNLDKAPLLKAMVLYLDNNHTMLFISMHHIISDGSSMQILLNEFCKIYNEEELPKNKFTYRDFINYENYFRGSDTFNKNKEFWLNEFSDEIPTLNMPTNFSRPASFTYNGATFTTCIDKNLTDKINSLCKNQQVTPYIFLLSVYYILLYKYTGQNSIVIGSPMANRDILEFSNIIGMFVNTIPIKTNIHSNQITFSSFLNEVKEKVLNCLVHGNYPFDELVKNLNLTRDMSRHPIFDTMFTYQSQGMQDLTLGNIKTQYYTPDTNISKFDLSLEIIPKVNFYTFNIEYCTDLFTKDFIEQLSEHYLCLIKNILNNLNTKICNLDMLSIQEKNKLLYEFNNTKVNYDKNDFIYKAIDRQSLNTPEYKAITFKNKYLTYKEFYEKTNSLANYLHKQGIGKNSFVGIMLPRSLELLVAIVATLKTGACYIPIDPSFPKSRVEYMLNNSNTSLLLTLKDNLDIERKQLNISLNNEGLYSEKELNFLPPTQSEDPAYLIYTSGSTGNPKGVVIPHRAITNLALSMNHDVEYLKEDFGNMSMASITTVSFDIFVFETLISLQKGLNIIIASEEEQVEPAKINELFSKNNVKAFQTTPSKMEIIINNKAIIPALNNVKYVTLVGEALTNNLKNKIVEIGITLYNAYGPTETTVFSTYTDVTNYDNVTIGKPMYNTQIFLLDKDNNICPIGIPGELCICGDGVGLGYKNISPNQKNNYTISPISKRKMYRTGDLAKYLPNGELLYIGRIDNQIKLRGLRIELEEIENKILEFKNIKKTVIVLQKDNSNREYLVAYITVKDKISINKLREHLRKYLPKYMIPSYFEILDEFPYTPNGKVDKKLLPLPQIQTKAQEFVGPRNDLDKKILEIFERLLNLSPIGIKDNFFELGGDSLLAINLQLEIMKVTDGISYADIFLNPTVQELTDKINNLNNVVESLSDTVNLLNCNTTIQTPINSDINIEKVNINNILLLGATGYLGAHILNEFLNTESGNVYCLLRPEKGLSIENKLLNKLHFYFGEKFDNLINKRIFIINGDISLPNLGLKPDDYDLIKNEITTIINCAAKVSHFGKYELYKKINVDGVNNLIEFCKTNNKTLYHTSTTSVSGEKINANTDELGIETKTFTENNFFINQNLENVYVRSKFEAEKNIIMEIQNGLDAYIIRVGNLMGRYSDGHFQQNIEENAYINRIISFIRMKTIPEHFLPHTLEFTPIDYCAKAFVKILTHTHNSRIFHLIDDNVISIQDLLNIFNKSYYEITPLSNDEFKIFINSLIKNSNYAYLNGIISDFDNKGKLSYEKEISIDSTKTKTYLKNLNFEWPIINESYIVKFLNYLDILYKF